jgi:hypothetical protein
VLGDMSAVDYATALGSIKAALRARDAVAELALSRELGSHFREQYRRAGELARAEK